MCMLLVGRITFVPQSDEVGQKITKPSKWKKKLEKKKLEKHQQISITDSLYSCY